MFWGVANNIHDKIELREKTKEMIGEIEKLRRNQERELEILINIDNESIDLLVELDIDKKDRQEIKLIEIKLEKLKISGKTIKAIRSQINGHSSLSLVDF